MCINIHAAILATHKRPVDVRQLSSRNIGNESRVLLDKIDIHVEVLNVDYEKLSGDCLGQSSATIRKRVQAARDIQTQRFIGYSDIVCNADMRVREMRQFCKLQDEGVVLSLSKYQSLMRAVMSQMNFSPRAYHHILKFPWTSADLADALQYRSKLMMK